MLNLWIQSLIFIGVVYNSVLTANSTLVFINVIARHAERALDPAHESYPNDPNLRYNFDPPGPGKVSKSGELRALNLGKFLRKTYNGLLATNYVSGAVEARSTDTLRTKESLNFILQGLYPGVVVPTKFDTTQKDVLLYPQLCTEYIEDYLEARKRLFAELTKLKDFINKLCVWTGNNMYNPLAMYKLYMTLEAEISFNLPQPNWVDGIYPDGDLLKGLILEFDIMNDNVEMKRGNGGRLVKKIEEDMKSVRSGKMDKNRKLMLYVAYDLNIVAVLKALGIVYQHAPKFSSAIIVELHLIDEIYHVKIDYYLGIPEKVKTLQIPNCETLCPLDKFSALIKDVLPTDRELECDIFRGANGRETLSTETHEIMYAFTGIVSE